MRTIAVVSVARSDFGIYLPIIRRIEDDESLNLCLMVSGMHLSPEFGLTANMIEAAGFSIAERVEMLVSSDSPEAISKSIGLGIIGFAQIYARSRPDVLVVLGDRYEMYAAALAALPFKIPVAHIHGGELTAGAIDDALRHSLSKMSHLHFVATRDYAQRVTQLGEEPWRILISGAPSLDNLHGINLLSFKELQTRFRISLEQPPLLVTFHPVTMEYEMTEYHMRELLAALDDYNMPIIFTMPNADTSGKQIGKMIADYVKERSSAYLLENLGTEAYFSFMAVASAMIGNSSSGIIEAPSFKLPVVNIGTRQTGRLKAENVIDVGYSRTEIFRGIRKAIEPDFRKGICEMANPYGDGQASLRIVNRLKNIPLDNRLLMKVFHEINDKSTIEN
jgi:UDP-N-acetylglucosamine 2-epimerase (non-hydrolysing)/GDP/UDP-N,N'-diacetylbacillosamine 2-epimerase (hydrolysing)